MYDSFCDYFQGGIMSSTLFMNRLVISNLLRNVRETFWRVYDIEMTDSEQEFFRRTYRRMTNQFITLGVLSSMYIVSVFFPVFFMKENELPFLQYQPSWMNIYELMVIRLIVLSVGLVYPATAIMTIMMIFITLTQLQFRLLNKEIDNIFNKDNEVSNAVIKKIIDHHNFLLR